MPASLAIWLPRYILYNHSNGKLSDCKSWIKLEALKTNTLWEKQACNDYWIWPNPTKGVSKWNPLSDIQYSDSSILCKQKEKLLVYFTAIDLSFQVVHVILCYKHLQLTSDRKWF